MPINDLTSQSDPLVKISLKSEKEFIGPSVTTHYARNNQNPVWIEEFFFNVHPKDHKLLFEVFNWDALNKNNYIGEVIIELATIPDNDKGIINKVYNITDREGENSPSIKLSLQFDQTGGKELH